MCTPSPLVRIDLEISMNNETTPPPAPAPESTAPVQKILGKRGLIIFLVLLGIFPPLSTDLYLPALPAMTKNFDIPEVMTNLTIILFFVFFSISSLFWGPLCDKHGRRKILLIGLTTYTTASLLCAFSPNIYMLITSRILQAIGAGAATATAMAIIKDVFDGKRMERAIATIQTISVVVPVIAPMLGAQLLKITDWRGAFYTQAFIGIVAVSLSVLFTETIRSRNSGNIFKTLGRLFVVIRNKRFFSLLMIFSFAAAVMMAYISASPYIYQNYFGLSEERYSFFFSFNAIMMVVGPFLYIRLSSRFRRFSLINASFIITLISGILIVTIGPTAPLAFALSMMPTTIMVTFIAPPTRFLMLSQIDGDTGSASALIAAFSSIAGSLGMVIASLDIGNHFLLVGGLDIVISVVCAGVWLFLTSRPLLRDLRQ